VLLVLAIVGRFAMRVGLPSIPLYLNAGLLLGEGGPFPLEESRDIIAVGADIGVVMMLLVLGLEYSPSELRSGLRSNWPAGLVDLLTSFPPGVILGLVLGWDPVAAVLLGGITYISSSGIIAKLLSDFGRIANRETPVVLSVLVIEDIAMAVFLPLLVVVLSGGTALAAAVAVGAALGLVLLVLVATRHLGHHLGRILGHDDDEQVLLRVLGLMLVVAGLTHLVDASAAVGAFLVGLAIPTGTAERARDVLRPLRDLFAALFFLSFGLETAPAELGPYIPVALALVAVTSLTKIGTGVYAAGREGVGPRGRVRAGTALVARGEFSIVIAELAVTAGYTEIGPLASAYVVILGISGPLLARYADTLAGPWTNTAARAPAGV
jgi:CPA2 family monovalent cation:H+ antiporter-2